MDANIGGSWLGEMDESFPALHKAIVGVDIEGFADRRRTNPDQVVMRAGLYRCLRIAFARSGIAWEVCYDEDRGDGALILVPPEVPMPARPRSSGWKGPGEGPRQRCMPAALNHLRDDQIQHRLTSVLLSSAIQRMIDEYLYHVSELRKHLQAARFGPVRSAPFGAGLRRRFRMSAKL